MPKICLIDGSGYIFRAFHALPPLRTKDGIPVNAVYGFAKSIMKLQKQRDVEYISVIFDASRISFRRSIYKEYKAHRPPAPEDLIPQFPLIRQMTKELNIKSIEKDGFEADDLIATYAKLASDLGIEVEIISSDKDLMQLVEDSKNIHMFDPIKDKKITEKEVFEKFSVSPDKVIYIQALMGDSSDNVPGVKGVGLKGAIDLINQFGDLDSIYNNIDTITKKALKQNLIANKDMAYISKDLVTLKKDVPVDVSIEELKKQKFDPQSLCEFFQKLSFNSLASSVASEYNIKLSPKVSSLNTESKGLFSENDFELTIHNDKKSLDVVETPIVESLSIQSFNELESLAKTLSKNRIIPFLCTFNKDGLLDRVSIYDEINRVNHLVKLVGDNQGDLFDTTAVNGVLESLFFKAFKLILEDESIKKLGYDIKPFLHLCDIYEVLIKSYDDIMQMGYLIEGTISNENPILEHVRKHLLIEEYTSDEEIGADILSSLYEVYRHRLINDRCKYLYEVFDKPLLEVLKEMEKNGILVDGKILNKLSEEFVVKLGELEKEIYRLSAIEFNIGSPKQLGEVLFEKMGIKGKKSKTGAWKTEASVLESLVEEGIEIASLILRWRQLSKLKNTYTDKLPEKINSNTGRIHTTFLPCSTSTGRLSSVEPNLQNIPIKSEDGKNIRRAFVAKAGYKMISLDYSQIELRVLARVANVKKLIQSFELNEDIHKKTASEIFDIPINEVDSNLRRLAKAINFGIIYGQTPFGLASHLGISREKAKEYIESYFKKYPEIKTYMMETVDYARKYGFVKTLFNRRCFVNGINNSNANIRNFAERASINAIIQGSASDIMRKSLIDIHKFINKNNHDIKILLQIHDELVLESNEKIAESIAKNLKEIMENACDIGIKLEVDYEIDNSWFS